VQTRQVIAEQWLGRVLGTYPGQAAAFLAEERDPFRNPVGNTFRQALATLTDEVLLGMNQDRVRAALDSIVQIRAVQDLTPSHALEFLFQLKPILSRHAPGPELDQLYSRVDGMVLLALDLYMKYRQRTFEARANEVKRRVYVLERRFGAHQEDGWQERGVK
jgi:RsbT co-antagonist protein rsbRD N-terminal domain